MVAKYIMQEVKDLNNEGDTLLYPRMVIRDSCGTDELAEYISAHTSFSPAEVKNPTGAARNAMRQASG